MKHIFVFIFAVSIPLLAARSQTYDVSTSPEWKKYLHVEAGLIYPEGSIKESVAIRQNISYFFANQFSSGHVSSTSYGILAGARYEYYYPRFKSGLSAGLRFTGFNTEISGYTSSNSEFFYLRYSIEDNNTKFARIKLMEESNYYLTVPIEVKVVPLTYRNLSLYAKAGVEFSLLRFGSGADITFQDEIMDQNKESVLTSITGESNKFYSTFNSAIGVIVGHDEGPKLLFEVFLPSLFLTENNYKFIDTEYYSGMKLSLAFPINRQK